MKLVVRILESLYSFLVIMYERHWLTYVHMYDGVCFSPFYRFLCCEKFTFVRRSILCD